MNAPRQPLAHRVLRDKVLTVVQHQQFSATMQFVAEAEAFTSARSAIFRAEVMVAKAEVNRLAGARDEAAASLRAAPRIYEAAGLPSSPRRSQRLSQLSPSPPTRSPA